MFDPKFIEDFAAAVAARIPQLAPGAKRLLTISQAAEYLGRSPKAIEHLIARGVLPVTKLDGKRQIDRIALDKLISENTYFAA
jgi:excisionase family DNA binding protein